MLKTRQYSIFNFSFGMGDISRLAGPDIALVLVGGRLANKFRLARARACT
jgi:hypothetical protein